MVSLTSSQKEISTRIKKDIDREIGMCDDYADLILLATIMWNSAKTIFTSYAKDYGEDALERAISETKTKGKL